MSNKPQAYLAGIGMITSIGANATMTSASVEAGISGYQVTDFFNMQGHPMTLAPVPPEVFTSSDIEINEGAYYTEHYDHIIKMAIFALREAVSHSVVKQAVPLVLAIPEETADTNDISIELLIQNLVAQEDLPLREDWVYRLSTGRAAGIQGLDLAMQVLHEQGHDYVLVGGSDSYWDASRLYSLDEDERVLAPNRADGFAPGEGAGFLLLTRDPRQALSRDGQIITLSPPGISQEPGHLSSEQPYRGDGLALAFKQVLADCSEEHIDVLYTSMNGERFWAKECGVASMRNQIFLKTDAKIEHPADCYGDLGVATGPVLVGLAATRLLNQPEQMAYLVYASSDGPTRAAVRVEKTVLNHNYS